MPKGSVEPESVIWISRTINPRANGPRSAQEQRSQALKASSRDAEHMAGAALLAGLRVDLIPDRHIEPFAQLLITASKHH